MIYREKLIEVALPLDVINKASVRESYIYRGNSSGKREESVPLSRVRQVFLDLIKMQAPKNV